MVVVLDISANTQSFFTDNDEDVVALCLDPSRRIAESGKVASLKRRTSEGQPSAVVMISRIQRRIPHKMPLTDRVP